MADMTCGSSHVFLASLPSSNTLRSVNCPMSGGGSLSIAISASSYPFRYSIPRFVNFASEDGSRHNRNIRVKVNTLSSSISSKKWSGISTSESSLLPIIFPGSWKAASSNSESECSYDIFLSFRGLDTRTKFTDHLYEALKREGFDTFRDENGIEKGENIKSELRKAIRNSRMSIIVLSEHYVKSTACLFEIQTIVEHRKKKSDHVILPVFYEVDPGKIKEQAKELGELTGEEVNFEGKKVTVDDVKRWSAALKEVASMAGMVSENQSNGYEAKFVEEIIGILKSKQAGDYPDLAENMQKLKRKVEYLRGQENDINLEISSAERQLWKRPKKQVEVWLKDVQRLKEDVQMLEQEVIGEMTFFSRIRLGKDIVKKIQEASELEKKGREFGGLLIDELPIGRLPVPLPKDFVKFTKARNTEYIWESLMNDDIRKIGVYGMGGVGKTTIIKYIHNQLLEEKGKLVYWVTVSKTLSITNLQGDIAKAMDLRLWEEKEVTRRASHLYAALSQHKSYVLILDDVWDPFDLEMVGIPEPTTSNGCKLLLTTRSLEVCQRMDCKPINVNLLTEEESWDLFLTRAVGHDTMLAPDVEKIAYQISKECAGLPLAIVTIAGSLRGLKEPRDWRNALNVLIHSRRDTCDVSKVFKQLKFSYDRLGDKVLQDCFLYCSLYPEDHEIKVKELIQFWICEGLISEMNSAEAELDDGHAILRKLISSCLLESSIGDWRVECVRMHDLIRDMALKITACSPRFLVKAGEIIESVRYDDWPEDLDKISFMFNRITRLPIRPPVCPRLSTLRLNGTNLSEIADCFFTNMPCLKVLDLSLNNIESLPESISHLETLQAIILHECWMLKYVPSLKKLKALKEFKLTKSMIEEIPEGIEDLVNIRKLDLSYNKRLGMVPSWKLHRLSNLQYLNMYETDGKLSAEHLLGLRQLKVIVAEFHNLQELTKYVTSPGFQGLERYYITVGEFHNLQKLAVFHNLKFSIAQFRKRLTFYHYKLLGEFPSSPVPEGKEVCIGSDSVDLRSEFDCLVLPSDLESFGLSGFCYPISFSAIPCLKYARDLRHCFVSTCRRLESVFSSLIFSYDGQIILRTVETLLLCNLPRFRVLFDEIGPPHRIHFNLKELYIVGCYTVKNIFPVQLLHNFPNLKKLCVHRCKSVEGIIFEREEISDWGHNQGDSKTITLPKLKTLELYDLPSLKSIYDGLMVCPSIEDVHVKDCPMVKRLPLSLHMDGEQARAPPTLKLISAQRQWWESLEWDDPLTKTILQPYVRFT